MVRFCEYCGKRTEGAVCGCLASGSTTVTQANTLKPPAKPVPPPPPPPKRNAVPNGFAHDPSSGHYYKFTPGIKSDTGQSGTFITWFYPDTGDFTQSFTPDVNATNPAPRYMEIARNNQPSAGKKKIKPAILIAIISCVVLLIGVWIFTTRNNPAEDILGTWFFSEMIDAGERIESDGAIFEVMTFTSNGVVLMHDDAIMFDIPRENAENTYEIQANGIIRIWHYNENSFDARIEGSSLILQGRNSYSWLGSDRLVRKP